MYHLCKPTDDYAGVSLYQAYCSLRNNLPESSRKNIIEKVKKELNDADCSIRTSLWDAYYGFLIPEMPHYLEMIASDPRLKAQEREINRILDSLKNELYTRAKQYKLEPDNRPAMASGNEHEEVQSNNNTVENHVQQAPATVNTWNCNCGRSGITTKFCPDCGKPKPEPKAGWTCPECSTADITSNFCPNCGTKKPEERTDWNCSCGQTGIKTNFCPNCGSKKP